MDGVIAGKRLEQNIGKVQIKIQNPKVARTLPGLIVLVLVVGVIALLSGRRVLSGNPTGEVPFTMPDTLGQYKSVGIWFCLNGKQNCGRAFEADMIIGDPNALRGTNSAESATGTITDPSDASFYVCPYCASDLSEISYGELRMLPANTPIFRKLYYTGGDKNAGITATVVFSGIERRSIHKPQICLDAQGSRITNEFPMDIDIGGGNKITLRILELKQTFGDKTVGEPEVQHSIFAYWLFNPERETDSHNVRFWHMCVDNALRNYRPRWGYASLTFVVDSNNPELWKAKLSDFMRHFYPLITETRKALDAQRDITVTIEKTSADVNTAAGAAEGGAANEK